MFLGPPNPSTRTVDYNIHSPFGYRFTGEYSEHQFCVEISIIITDMYIRTFHSTQLL